MVRGKKKVYEYVGGIMLRGEGGCGGGNVFILGPGVQPLRILVLVKSSGE